LDFVLQLVTSEHRVVVILVAQPTQALPCSIMFQHILIAGTNSHAPTFFFLADCVHGITGHALKLISALKLTPYVDIPLSTL
jgi:hypothetical protein